MRLEDLQGQRFGRYEITAVLGRGGMAAVYRAHDTLLRRDVALKVIYPQYSVDTALIARFKREAVLAAQLDHPNIVPIYDVGEANGLVYIAMKLLVGRSLADRLRLQPALPLPELIPIVEQIAAALDYAHERGIVHRDIKAGNIILEGPDRADPAERTTIGAMGPRAVLTDFGIAKSLDAPGMTGTGVLLGTPDYMAPEQIRGERIDGRADIYALGVLVYRCLTGRRLFEGGTEEVLLGHLHGQVPAPSSVAPSLPPAIDPVVQRAIARRPDDRYPSAGAFVHALRAAAGMELPTPPPARRRDMDGRVVVPRLAADDMARRRTAAEDPTRKTSSVRPPPIAPPVQRARSGGGAAGGVMIGLLLLLMIGGGGMLLAQALQDNSPRAPLVVAATARPTAAAPTPAPVAAAPTDAPTSAPTEAPTAQLATALPTATLRPTRTIAPAATAPPTDTPTPAPTSTPTPLPCSEPMQGGFSMLWAASARIQREMGCPARPEQGGRIAEEPFQYGSMFWYGPLNTIYVLVGQDAGHWSAYGPNDMKNMPTPASGPAPDGLYRPISGFGLVWGSSQGLQSELGWATQPEAGPYDGAYQPFERGIMLFSPVGLGRGKTLYVLYADGTFERYDDPNKS